MGAALTRRESQIAELFAWGASKKDVSSLLFISERTVENHTRSIYGKTGCSKVNELSAWWFCTTFHIPFDLSPLKRRITAFCLLCVIVPQTLSHTDGFAAARTGRTAARVARAGRRGEETAGDGATYLMS